MRDKSAAFTLPCVPIDSPQAPQPEGLTLPLFPHQLRSLYLMKIMEDRSQLENIIPGKDYKTKGGIIADEVGMGKTALVIGLILANKRLSPEMKDGSLGGTLVVTPDHLCDQWLSEVKKFSKLRCVVFNHVSQVATPQAEAMLYKHDVVVASMDLISKLQFGAGATGPWVWRRAVFDECHEAIKFGHGFESFTWLQAHSRNVWLVTGTPFPHGDASMYAMHRLLGIKFKLVVSNNIFQRKNVPLAADHPFECLKHRVYLRNTRASTELALGGIKRQGVATTTTSNSPAEQIERISDPSLPYDEVIIRLDLSNVERGFYDSQLRRGEYANPFAPSLVGLRMLCCHPAVEQAFKQVGDGGLQNLEQLRKRFLVVKEERAENLREKVAKLQLAIRAAFNALVLVDDMRTHHPEGGVESDGKTWWRLTKEVNGVGVANLVSSLSKARAYAAEMDPEDRTRFLDTTIAWVGNAKLKLAEHEVEQKNLERDLTYFQSLVNEIQEPKKECMLCTEEVTLVSITPCGHFSCTACLTKWVVLKRSCPVCRKMLSEAELTKVDTSKLAPLNDVHSSDPMVDRFGTKPAALIRFIQATIAQDPTAKFIVFSQWHSALHLLSQSLLAASISNTVYLQADKEGGPLNQLTPFTDGPCRVLMLSLESQAAGLNLQCANHVILMEPPGSNPNDALSIETQAVGRALRIGQKRRLTVTRLHLRNTIEEKLFEMTQAVRVRTGRAATSDLLSTLGANKLTDSNGSSTTTTDSSTVDSSGSSSCSSSSESALTGEASGGGRSKRARKLSAQSDAAPPPSTRSKRACHTVSSSPVPSQLSGQECPVCSNNVGRRTRRKRAGCTCSTDVPSGIVPNLSESDFSATGVSASDPVSKRSRMGQNESSLGVDSGHELERVEASQDSPQPATTLHSRPVLRRGFDANPSNTRCIVCGKECSSRHNLEVHQKARHTKTQLPPPTRASGRVKIHESPMVDSHTPSVAAPEIPAPSLLHSTPSVVLPDAEALLRATESTQLAVFQDAPPVDISRVTEMDRLPSAFSFVSSAPCEILPSCSSFSSSTAPSTDSKFTIGDINDNDTSDSNSKRNDNGTSMSATSTIATTTTHTVTTTTIPTIGTVAPIVAVTPTIIPTTITAVTTPIAGTVATAIVTITSNDDDDNGTNSTNNTNNTNINHNTNTANHDININNNNTTTTINNNSNHDNTITTSTGNIPTTSTDNTTTVTSSTGNTTTTTNTNNNTTTTVNNDNNNNNSDPSEPSSQRFLPGYFMDVPWITDVMHCPICQKVLTGLSNAQVNRHVDNCVGR